MTAALQDAQARATPLRPFTSWSADTGADGVVRAAARLPVRADDPALRGHFPGLPILPGVFVVEALERLVGLATGARLRVLRSVRFSAPLRDGDELLLECSAKPVAGGWAVTATGRSAAGDPAARLSATCAPELGAPVLGEGPAAAGGAAEQAAVRAVLPQRHPLLLVDRVLALDPGRSVVTAKAVSATEPCYAGLPDTASDRAHDYPVSLLVESLGQSAALLWFAGRGPDPADGRTLMFVGARDHRVEGVARPGDVVRHRVRLESVIADTAFATGESWVGDRRIASVGSLVATRRPVPQRP